MINKEETNMNVIEIIHSMSALAGIGIILILSDGLKKQMRRRFG